MTEGGAYIRCLRAEELGPVKKNPVTINEACTELDHADPLAYHYPVCHGDLRLPLIEEAVL